MKSIASQFWPGEFMTKFDEKAFIESMKEALKIGEEEFKKHGELFEKNAEPLTAWVINSGMEIWGISSKGFASHLKIRGVYIKERTKFGIPKIIFVFDYGRVFKIDISESMDSMIGAVSAVYEHSRYKGHTPLDLSCFRVNDED